MSLQLFEIGEAVPCRKVATVPEGVKYSRIQVLTHGQINISGVWAVSQMSEGLYRGVHAFMPPGMHWIYCEIYRLWKSGKEVEATRLFQKIVPVLAFSNQHLDISIHFFKRLVYRQGIYPTSLVREPILKFDSIHEEIANQHIDTVIHLENEIKCKSSTN